MDTQLLLILIVTVSAYVFIGALFWYFSRSTPLSPEQRYRHLKEVVHDSAYSVEYSYPNEHPKQKRQRIEQSAYKVLAKSKLSVEDHIAISIIIDGIMLQMDTDPRLQAIRFSSETTRQITPPAGMMSLGIRHKAVQRTGKLVN